MPKVQLFGKLQDYVGPSFVVTIYSYVFCLIKDIVFHPT